MAELHDRTWTGHPTNPTMRTASTDVGHNSWQKGHKMFVRIGLITALVLAASPAGAADQLTAPRCEHVGANATQPSANEWCLTTSQPQGGALASYSLLPNPDPASDISSHGLNSHNRLLTQYALYASLGNRDGMQIISDQLRRFGVTRGEIEDFANRAKVHTGSLPERRRTDSEIESGWKLSQ